MANDRRTEALRAAIAPLCASLEVELYDVQLSPGSLLVTIERSGGLDLDVIAATSRAIAELLDEREELAPPTKYELEVSSPGIERRLRRYEHFVRAIGDRVAMRTTAGTPGDRRFEGTLISADDEGVVLQLESGERRVAYGEIDRAHLVFDWRRELSAASARPNRNKTEAKRSSQATRTAADIEADVPHAKRERATTS